MRSLLPHRAPDRAGAAPPDLPHAPAPARAGAARAFRIAVAIGLLLLTLLPLYRLLDLEQTGIAGAVTRTMLDIYYDFTWSGLLLLFAVGIAGARLLAPERLDALLSAGRVRLLAPRQGAFVLGIALVAALAGALFSAFVLERTANFIDAFAQLLQARYWAAGQLAGPVSDHGGFWGIQNALFTDRGWVSQYPPGQVALLVPFYWLGVPWLFGPVLLFVTVAAAALLFARLFPERPALARLAALLLAISPFFIFVGASLMNHITTAACTCLGGYLLVRAWQEQPRWAIPAGLLFALSLATRPLSTLAVGGVFLVGVPLLWPRDWRRAGAVALFGLAGAAPPIIALLAYNDHFFGSPFTTGYSAALGPNMSLGFHRDPWGNWYGPLEALAYTSADLIALSLNLFETTLPAVPLIALFLLLAPRWPRALWFLLAWALVPVLANALYWHHGLYMGPRMLHETTPAWAALFAIAVTGILQRIPARLAVARAYFVRSGFAVMLGAACLMALVYLIPRRTLSYGGEWISVARTPLPEPPGRALVFVHDAWSGRTAMTLASAGLRLDIVETLIRQNSTCRVHELARTFAAGDRVAAARLLAALDTVPRAAPLAAGLDGGVLPAAAGRALPIPIELSPGNRLRFWPGEVLSAECALEALSDRLGTIDIAPLLVRADLHGAPDARVLIVRDLGPERNAALLRAHPGRTAWVYALAHPRGEPRLVPYESAMRVLWQAPLAQAPAVLRRHGLLP